MSSSLVLHTKFIQRLTLTAEWIGHATRYSAHTAIMLSDLNKVSKHGLLSTCVPFLLEYCSNYNQISAGLLLNIHISCLFCFYSAQQVTEQSCESTVCYNGGQCDVLYHPETGRNVTYCKCPDSRRYSGDRCEYINDHTPDSDYICR